MMTNRQFVLAGVSVLSLLASGAMTRSVALGTIVQTNSIWAPDDDESKSELAFAVSDDDLINTGQSTLAGVTHTNFVPVDVQDITKLNDGTVGLSVFAPDNNGFIDAVKLTVAGVDAEWQSTFDLNLAGAPAGYDITSVKTISGWPDRRSAQRYELYVSFVGDADFTLLGEFSVVAGSDVSHSTQIELTDTSGIIASGVDAVRFSFLSGFALPGAPAELLYRELDVFGVATVPEPCGASLLALGLLGVARFTRRRRCRCNGNRGPWVLGE